jgi:hypothetical protein
MFDLIASWMTRGGPLQELGRDDRGHMRPTIRPASEYAVEQTSLPDRAARLGPLPLVRRLRAARPLEACACLTDQCVPC